MIKIAPQTEQNFYTLTDLQAITGISKFILKQQIDRGNIPAPTHRPPTVKYISNKRWWNETELETIKDYFKTTKQPDLISKAQAAKLIGLSLNRMDFHIAKCFLPGPTHTIRNGGRKYYKKEEIPELKEKLANTIRGIPNGNLAKLKAQGYLSGNDVAKLLELPKITWANLIIKCVIPKPTHKVDGYYHPMYQISDVQKIKERLHQYGYKRMARRPRKTLKGKI